MDVAVNKDWVVWFGCFVLFGAGAVWGGVRFETDFFVVDNVHDLFEIFGAIATTVAVCVAASGLNSWKRQIRSAADHELARKVSVALHRYQAEVVNIWDSASSAHARLDYKVKLGGSLKDRVKENIDSDIGSAESARAEFQALMLECKAVWGSLLDVDAGRLIEFERHCSYCVKKYLNYFMYDGPSGRYGLAKSYSVVKRSWGWFVKNDFDSRESSMLYIDGLVSGISSKLSEKLL
ncbi:hypothetical protein D3C77_346180 [compost metagenome]